MAFYTSSPTGKIPIGLEVDCRFITQAKMEVATLEAARTMSLAKVNSDHQKLLLESKLIIDTFAMEAKVLPMKKLRVLSIQLSRYHAEILSLTLQDQGLYVATPYAKLSLPTTALGFRQVANLGSLACFSLRFSSTNF
ncbi:hypothetical protein DM01DRAFT_1174603 [Hesseltinella vesiculosa]|uniref:Uncharacterized protein n=1 Tax=Hesseltinella vesiculosa TaxID=101127 RepID=A0A1X2G6B4_9FUNG|nr:hypothetical protein DM01DRAFT_1174603 [Hesseltinella vesiculosa]